jgi:GNAT superfamily N-acetyltransferase
MVRASRLRARGRARESWRVALAGNPLVSLERAAALEADLRTRGYAVRRAAAADAPSLLPWIAAHFTDGWAFEVGRALELEPLAVHVAVHGAQGAVVAFAAHDGNNRGLGEFGPAGTLPAHRGQGLGAALLVRSLLDVAAAGHADSVILWVAPGEHTVAPSARCRTAASSSSSARW